MTVASGRELAYRAAIREALWQSMKRDERVFVLGQDLEYGGVYGITKGFLEEFGPDRVLDTPISETAIVGAAMGAALMGMRPVAEIQFADFIASGFDQLVNMTATYHYRTGVPVPMVLRSPAGTIVTAHGSTGPYHSQNPEAWFVHTPGLKVVLPATPYDAKGLLLSCLDDPNPVLFLEQKGLYNQKGPVPEEEYRVPLGEARLARRGRSISLITYGAMVPVALEAAEAVASSIDVEVVDLRTLVPLDKNAVLESVRKTGKVILLHEANLTGGFGSELAAILASEAFEHLDAPIVRVAGPDTPVPSANVLVEAYLPNCSRVEQAIRELAEY